MVRDETVMSGTKVATSFPTDFHVKPEDEKMQVAVKKEKQKAERIQSLDVFELLHQAISKAKYPFQLSKYVNQSPLLKWFMPALTDTPCSLLV